jgi:hypothetical protein
MASRYVLGDRRGMPLGRDAASAFVRTRRGELLLVFNSRWKHKHAYDNRLLGQGVSLKR